MQNRSEEKHNRNTSNILSKMQTSIPQHLITQYGKELLNLSNTNTLLHTAIVDNNLNLAKLIINSPEFHKIANKQSLLNTPLTLALKNGNIEIAELILSQGTKLDLSLKDCRGLSALDWACMLRQDKIINIICNILTAKKKSNCNKFYKSPNKNLLTEEKKSNILNRAKTLYEENVDYIKLENHIKHIKEHQAKLASIKSTIEKTVLERESLYLMNSISYKFSEADGAPATSIFDLRPYSDIKFFIEPICVNLNWIKQEDFAKLGCHPKSDVNFYYKFKFAIKDFCEKRNAIPVNKNILEALDKICINQDISFTVNSIPHESKEQPYMNDPKNKPCCNR